MKKVLLAILAAAAIMGLSIPAAAETFTSSDGVISMELPGDGWKEMMDPTRWVVLSDGANMITMDHYSNGEKLPEMTVADSHYVNVYQAVVSTQNEVFIITGFLVDANKIAEVCDAIMTAKVLKFDTKMAVKKDSAQSTSPDGFVIAAKSGTMYATAGINVRAGYSTNDEIIGALAEGDAMTVTGVVQRDGQDYGWYQIEYDGGNGFVSASFVSDSAPAPQTDANGETKKKADSIQFTSRAKTLYDEKGNAVTVYEATNGNWYDSKGNEYIALTDYEFSSGNSVYYTNKPQVSNEIYPVSEGFTVYWENGNGTTLTQYSDGYYYSSDWVRYTLGDGVYYGADGTTLYPTIPSYEAAPAPTGNSVTMYYGDGTPVTLYEYTDGSWYNSSGLGFAIGTDGNYHRTDGTILYPYPPGNSVNGGDSEDEANEQHYLVQVESGKEVLVSAGGGAYYDEAGTEYSWINDGQMMDFFGNIYNVRW